MLYIQHYIKTIHLLLKYNGLAIVRMTTKLIEGGQRGLQDCRYIPVCYYLYVFLRFYVFFSKFKKSSLFTFFCRVSYVFSNYGLNWWFTVLIFTLLSLCPQWCS